MNNPVIVIMLSTILLAAVAGFLSLGIIIGFKSAQAGVSVFFVSYMLGVLNGAILYKYLSQI